MTADERSSATPPDKAVPTVRHRRRRKIIEPGLQLKIGVIFTFVLISTLAFFAARMHLVVANHGGMGSEQVKGSFGEILWKELMVALALGIVLMMSVAVAVTFRIAGPAYRMRQFLKAVRRGTQTGPCRLRDGDLFHDLCELINEATAERRAQNEQSADTSSAPADQEAEVETAAT